MTADTQRKQQFEHQVAGHDTIQVLDSGKLCKPSTSIESAFYGAGQTTPIGPWLAKYYGTGAYTGDARFTCSIILENLVSPYTHPCIADIKIGTRLYSDDAPDAKKARMEEQARSTTSGSTGMRVCGIKVYDAEVVKTYDKAFGRSLTPDTLIDGLRVFLPPSVDLGILRAFVSELNGLRRDLARTTARVYSASVLLLYEGARCEAAEAPKNGVQLLRFHARAIVWK
ncbi:hypothetical protein SeMB42_g00445 [Synchytrium endobioticum]|uniref:Kinase n=1 Tax=Synchytrium endobioticum TaxID=286115 RepID=A0A507DSV2_9FUNG|nr:hypothetical protein SeMB42_g00445 [Synchytrium endobioticum]